MFYDGKIWIGKSGDEKIFIEPKMASRHGLITGATGTGKTITLKVLAESFSDAGVPVFLADIKGDLSGMCRPGVASEDMTARIQKFGLAECGFDYHAYPSTFWDIYGEMGIPARTTISEMGPILLSKIMDLNDTQSDILTVVFKIADDKELLLIDTNDLKAMLQYVSENSAELSADYGNIAKQSVAAILRNVVALEAAGAETFFGEPALNLSDWFFSNDMSGKGSINILDCRKLVQDTTLYSTFLLWMLSELFETLPEVGDLEKPRMVFFFDEAHLLFKDISKALKSKIEQVVKLIRSKGVGVYFISQSPSDIPDEVLAQLGNKIQHALRAYTPAEEKAVKAAAQSFRANPEFDTYEAITSLGVGEALISVLDAEGVPTVVKKSKILPPQSMMGGITDEEKTQEVLKSALYLRYKDEVDPDSAYEFMQRMKKEEAEAEQAEAEAAEAQKLEKAEAKAAAKKQTAEEKAISRAKKSVASTAAGTIGRELGKSVGSSFGTFGKRLGGNVGASLARNILGTFLK